MLSTLGIRSLALDHRAAAVALRGRVALDAEAVRAALADPTRPAEPALILATCNRLELVWIGTDATAQWWRARLGVEATTLLEARRGRAVVRHLVRVASGLESQLLGEAEILGQMRRAYALAREGQSTDGRLDLIVERALAGARRVRAESMLGRHAHSVSEAAVRLVARQAGGSLQGRTVAVIGAGEAACGVLAALQAAAPAHVLLVNRNPVRAAAAAAVFGITDVRPWYDLAAALSEAHVVICATAARQPVITPAMLATGATARTPRWFVDLSVPHNVDPALRAREDVTVLDLDDLRALGCPEAAADSVALLAAEALVEREVRRIGAALRARQRRHAIGALHALGEQVAAEESARFSAELGGALTPQMLEAVQQVAQRVARRVLFPVSRYLRAGDAPGRPVATR